MDMHSIIELSDLVILVIWQTESFKIADCQIAKLPNEV
jgi:hypothetical protein